MRYSLMIGIIVGMFGCGDVEPAVMPDSGAAGTGGTVASTGGTGGTDVDGGGGTTGMAGTAGPGTGGSGGKPLKQLGEACAENNECDAPHLCVASAAGGTACCDGRPDACNTCVDGHLQAVPDGTSCGTQPSGITCTGTYTSIPGPINVYGAAQKMACTAGACGLTTVSCSMLSCSNGLHPACRVDILSSGAPQMEGSGCGCYM